MATGDKTPVEPPVAPGWVPVRDRNGDPIVHGDRSLVAKRVGENTAGVRWEVRLHEMQVTPTQKKASQGAASQPQRMTAPPNRGVPPKSAPQPSPQPSPQQPTASPGWDPVKDVHGNPIVSGNSSLVAKRVDGELVGLGWVAKKRDVTLDEMRVTPTKQQESRRLTGQHNRGLPPKPSPQKLTERDDPEPGPATGAGPTQAPASRPTTAPLDAELAKAVKDAEEEARGLKNRLDKDQTVTPNDVRIAGRNLVDAARRAGTPIAPDILDSLANDFDELIKKEADRIRSGAGRGQGVDPRLLDKLAQTGMGVERQRELFGRGTKTGGLSESVTAVAEIMREQLKNDVTAVNKAKVIGQGYARFLATRLLSMGRQDALLGQNAGENPIDLAKQLAPDARRVPMVDEAKDLIARANKGERFREDYVEFMRSILEQEEGQQGRQLADELHKMQLSWFYADRENLSRRVSGGGQPGPWEIEVLAARAVRLGIPNEDSPPGELKGLPPPD